MLKLFIMAVDVHILEERASTAAGGSKSRIEGIQVHEKVVSPRLSPPRCSELSPSLRPVLVHMKRILLRVSNMHMNEYELTAGSNKWTGLSVLKEMHKDHLHRNVQKLKCRQRTVERMTVIIVA